jgi:hypothetical protein
MPVNEKLLFGSFQYLFYLKTIIYAILSSAMLRENHAVLGGKNINFRRGGGINIRFRPKYRPLFFAGWVKHMLWYCTISAIL